MTAAALAGNALLLATTRFFHFVAATVFFTGMQKGSAYDLPPTEMKINAKAGCRKEIKKA